MSRPFPRRYLRPPVLAALALAVARAAAAPTSGPAPFAGAENLPPAVAARVGELLGPAARGDHPLLVVGGERAEKILPGVAARLPPEGFAYKVGRLGGEQVLAVVGRPGEDESGTANRGLSYGTYAALEAMGFGFPHPLQPVRPYRIHPVTGLETRQESPRWPHRVLHLHTMHPTELADLVNGWGPGGPDDQAGWEAGLAEWSSLMEWLLANRQNRVQWVLLDDPAWGGFSEGPVRQARMKRLVEIAHQWGIEVGVDVPVALGQQNGFRLIRSDGDLASQLAEMDARVDWLMGAGFDYLTTEWGSSEFTSPDEEKMLAWLNHLAARCDEVYGAPVTVKVHVTVAEESKRFRHPETGDPWNINFVPHYADPRLGVEVHTVQHYALDDPAPTYGREDFRDLYEFLQMQVGRRAVHWYPETAYWVSFDVDVPLFLPVYAHRRVHDLRLIAADEAAGKLGRGDHAGGTMQGQTIFSSGWEWGYWLNDAVAARAAWNPHLDAPDDDAAFAALLDEVLAFLGNGRAAARESVARLAADQYRDLIRAGRDPSPGAPALPERWMSGQSYLQGVETWDDAMDLLAKIPFAPTVETQPPRIGPVRVREGKWSRRYVEHVRPLLTAMRAAHGAAAGALEGLAAGADADDPGAGVLAELADAARITALRADQVQALYDVASRYRRKDKAFKAARLGEAAAALDQAAAVVARREAAYRVDAARIAGWRDGPTSYPFGYLWTARSLYYWWRDEGKVRHKPRSPCYLNILDPFEVGGAEGGDSDMAKRLRWIVDHMPVGEDFVRPCLEPMAAPIDFEELVRGRAGGVGPGR